MGFYKLALYLTIFLSNVPDIKTKSMVISKTTNTDNIAIHDTYNVLVCEPKTGQCTTSAKIGFHGDIKENNHYHFKLSGEHQDIYGQFLITDLHYEYDQNFEYFTFDPNVGFSWSRKKDECNKKTYFKLRRTNFTNSYSNKLRDSSTGTFKYHRINDPNTIPTTDEPCCRFHFTPNSIVESVIKIKTLKPRFNLTIIMNSCTIKKEYNTMKEYKTGQCENLDVSTIFDGMDTKITPILISGRTNSHIIKQVHVPAGNPSVCEYGWIQVTGEQDGNLYVNQNCISATLKFDLWYLGDPEFTYNYPGKKINDYYNENRKTTDQSILKCNSYDISDYELKQGSKCELRLDMTTVIKGMRVLINKPDKVLLKNLKLTKAEGHFYSTETATGTVSFTCVTIPANMCKYIQGIVVSQMPSVTFAGDYFSFDEGLNEIEVNFRVMIPCKTCKIYFKLEPNIGESVLGENEINLKEPTKIIHDKIKEIEGNLEGDGNFFIRLWRQIVEVTSTMWQHLKYWFRTWYSWLILIILIIITILIWIYLPIKWTKWKVIWTIMIVIVHFLIVGLV